MNQSLPPSVVLEYAKRLMFNCGMVTILYWAHLIYPNFLLSAFLIGTSLYAISRLCREVMGTLHLPFSLVLPPALFIGWLMSSAFTHYISDKTQIQYAQAGCLILAFLAAYKTKAWLDIRKKQT